MTRMCMAYLEMTVLLPVNFPRLQGSCAVGSVVGVMASSLHVKLKETLISSHKTFHFRSNHLL